MQDWIKTGQVDQLFHAELGWPAGMGRLLWKAGRNPIAHISQTNAFHTYAKFNGSPAYLQLDFFQPWSEPQPAYVILPHPSEAGAILVFVSYDGLRSQLSRLSDLVADRIEAMSTLEGITKITEVNAQIPH